MKTYTKQLRLAQLKIETAFQLRVELNHATITEYAEAMLAGETFPPISVVNHNGIYILADGFHRVEATRQANKETILAEIVEGDDKTALKIAVQANRQHGLRITSADKRRAIELVLRKWFDKSNREIAKMVGCTDPTVGAVRREVLKFCAFRRLAVHLSDADSKQFTELKAVLDQHWTKFASMAPALLELRDLDPDAFPGWCEEHNFEPWLIALVDELFGRGAT